MYKSPPDHEPSPNTPPNIIYTPTLAGDGHTHGPPHITDNREVSLRQLSAVLKHVLHTDSDPSTAPYQVPDNTPATLHSPEHIDTPIIKGGKKFEDLSAWEKVLRRKKPVPQAVNGGSLLHVYEGSGVEANDELTQSVGTGRVGHCESEDGPNSSCTPLVHNSSPEIAINDAGEDRPLNVEPASHCESEGGPSSSCAPLVHNSSPEMTITAVGEDRPTNMEPVIPRTSTITGTDAAKIMNGTMVIVGDFPAGSSMDEIKSHLDGCGETSLVLSDHHRAAVTFASPTGALAFRKTIMAAGYSAGIFMPRAISEQLPNAPTTPSTNPEGRTVWIEGRVLPGVDEIFFFLSLFGRVIDHRIFASGCLVTFLHPEDAEACVGMLHTTETNATWARYQPEFYPDRFVAQEKELNGGADLKVILDRLAASWMTINNQLRRDINRQGERISDLEAENKAMGVRNSELKFKHKGEMRGLAKQLDTNMETFTNDHKKRHYNDLQKLKKQHQKNLSELNEEHMARINYKDECLARVRNTQEFMENSIKRLQEKLAEMETSAALMENRLVEKEASVVVLRNTRERMEAIIAGLHIKLEELGLGYCELYGPAASKLNKED